MDIGKITITGGNTQFVGNSNLIPKYKKELTDTLERIELQEKEVRQVEINSKYVVLGDDPCYVRVTRILVSLKERRDLITQFIVDLGGEI